MATSARPDATAQAASRKAMSPVADAFSMWVTGRPVRPSSFMALMPSIDAGLDVADEGLVDVGQRDAGVVQGEQAGVAGQLGGAAVRVVAEPDHADAGDGGALDLHAGAPDSIGRNR